MALLMSYVKGYLLRNNIFSCIACTIDLNKTGSYKDKYGFITWRQVLSVIIKKVKAKKGLFNITTEKENRTYKKIFM